MICTFDQISSIIKNNPNKATIKAARSMADALMLNVFGKDLKSNVNRCDYFENTKLYDERKKIAVSNQDLFERILRKEELVFTSVGGATYNSGLSKKQDSQMNTLLDSVRFGMNIRKWIEHFALNAYRTDPMSVILMEYTDNQTVYPTYKSSYYIYDYCTNGRKVDHICFNLTIGDCRSMGLDLASYDNAPDGQMSCYFRFIDDAHDGIYKYESSVVNEIDALPNPWGQVPAFVVSDIINFADSKIFLSPLAKLIELANTFQNDRSIRDLSKFFTGFPKTIEPLVVCETCLGSGYVDAQGCPSCTPPGYAKGTGTKLYTKVSDVLRYPINQADKVNVKNVFGYVTPDIATWDKQDTSLNDIENLLKDVYWGTDVRENVQGPTTGKNSSKPETATKTNSNLQPVYSRLNTTADWAERTETMICTFIGQFLFPASFKSCIRAYGRYYILETPDDLMLTYLDMKAKSAPQFSLNEALRRYYCSFYESDPIQLQIKLKLIDIEPFVHYSLANIQAANPAKIDYIQKMYFSEWLTTKTDDYLLISNEQALRDDLLLYATAKTILTPELIAESVGTTENIRTTS